MTIMSYVYVVALVNDVMWSHITRAWSRLGQSIPSPSRISLITFSTAFVTATAATAITSTTSPSTLTSPSTQLTLSNNSRVSKHAADNDPIPADALISIIIPTFNESSSIIDTIRITQREDAHIEIIVVDAGSTDSTMALISNIPRITVLPSTPGRATCLNRGAQHAHGQILLFLHADTQLPSSYGTLIRSGLSQSGIIAGAFQFQCDERLKGIGMVEYFTNLRARYLQMPYGDQALHMRRSVFERYGGFPQQDLMEDFELVRRLRRDGHILIHPEAAITSARRWKKLGVFRTTLTNQVVIAGYYLGVPSSHLRRLYYTPAEQPKNMD